MPVRVATVAGNPVSQLARNAAPTAPRPTEASTALPRLTA